MRILLRNVLTRLYLAESGEWVEDYTQARDFQTTIAALKFGQTLGSKHMEMVFSFGTPQYDLTVPVDTTPRHPEEPPPSQLPTA